MGLVRRRHDDLAALNHAGLDSVRERRLPLDDEEQLRVGMFVELVSRRGHEPAHRQGQSLTFRGLIPGFAHQGVGSVNFYIASQALTVRILSIDPTNGADLLMLGQKSSDRPNGERAAHQDASAITAICFVQVSWVAVQTVDC